MAVCRYFLQGHCKFGSSCRFEHPSGGNAGYAYSAQRQLFGGGGRGGGGNRQSQYRWQASDYSKPAVSAQTTTSDVINALISEITDWEKNKMWPFSCVALEKECPCIPDFTDHSPEELRTAAYEALRAGNIQSYIQQAQKLSEEYKQKRSQVKNMTMTMKQKLISMIEDYRRSKNKSGSSSSNSASLFSQSNKSAFGSSGDSKAFGASSTHSNSAFGSTFGATGTISNPFGNTGTGSNDTFGVVGTSTNAFGASSSPFSNTSFGSAFGSSVQPDNRTGFSGSGFGDIKGTSPLSFGAQPNHTALAFGPSSSTPTAFPSSLPQTQTGFNTSVLSTQPQQTTGLFGKPSTSPAMNLSGSFTTQTQSGFQPAASGSSFPSSGASSSSFSLSGAAASGFPSQGATAAGSNVSPKRYTPLDQLTPGELEAFQAPTFTLGQIPTRPPPIELC